MPGMESGSSSRNVGNSSNSSSSSSSSNDGRGSDVAEYDDSGDGGGYDESYYSMPPWEKGAIAGAYFSLIAALVLAMVRLLLHPPHTPQPRVRPQPSTALHSPPPLHHSTTRGALSHSSHSFVPHDAPEVGGPKASCSLTCFMFSHVFSHLLSAWVWEDTVSYCWHCLGRARKGTVVSIQRMIQSVLVFTPPHTTPPHPTPHTTSTTRSASSRTFLWSTFAARKQQAALNAEAASGTAGGGGRGGWGRGDGGGHGRVARGGNEWPWWQWGDGR